MARFRVLAGIHLGPNGRVFGPGQKDGDIIESDQPLDHQFRNKFQALDRVQMRARDRDDTLDLSGKTTDVDLHARQTPPPAPAAPTRTADRTYAPGQEPTDEDTVGARDLETGDELGPQPDVASQVEGGAEGEEGEGLGTDVTDEFKGAEEGQLKVFKSGKKYYVARADDPSKALNARKELTKKADVSAYVKSHATKGTRAEGDESDKGDEE